MWGDLGKLIVAKGFKNLPKVQYIAQSGHTDTWASFCLFLLLSNTNFTETTEGFSGIRTWIFVLKASTLTT